MDLNPRLFAGPSADEEDSSGRAEVAELGIGKAEGSTRSANTTLSEFGSPSCGMSA